MKGTKPDFHKAMDNAPAKEMYNKFLEQLRSEYKKELAKAKVPKLDEQIK